MMSPWFIRNKRKKQVRYKVTLPRIELREPTNIDRPNKQLDYNTNSLFLCLNIFIGQIIGGTEIKEKKKGI